jgi:thiosulfate dehydrogenase [quinone] large subunit
MTRTSTLSRSTTLILTAIAAGLFLLLSGAFGKGLLSGPIWHEGDWVDSPLITWLLLGLIVLAGIAQARRLPAHSLELRFHASELPPGQTAAPLLPTLLFGNVFWAILALPVRIFVGRVWFGSGIGKVTNPAWTETGEALHGFWRGAVAVNESGQGKITYDWYRAFLLFMDNQHWYVWFAKLIVAGELLVGIGLLAGGVVGVAALGGAFLNVNYGLAGSASANPILMALGVTLVLAWRTAGYWGVDRWLLPLLGASRHAGVARPGGAAGSDRDVTGSPRQGASAPVALRPARAGRAS